MFKIKVIFENQDFLIVDKPAGLVVNRANTVKGKTLQDWMEERFVDQSVFKLSLNEENEEFINRSGLVHRLDKETSGLVILAKNSHAFQFLKAQFKQRRVRKSYLALVHGRLEPKQGDIRLPLARLPKQRRKFGVVLGGRSALTFYQVKKFFNKDGEEFSLLEVKPRTGRTHQIRVHLQHLGHPLVSDPLYLGKKRLQADKKWCPRLFLHAAGLEIIEPTNKKLRQFSSPLSTDLSAVLKENLKVE